MWNLFAFLKIQTPTLTKFGFCKSQIPSSCPKHFSPLDLDISSFANQASFTLPVYFQTFCCPTLTKSNIVRKKNKSLKVPLNTCKFNQQFITLQKGPFYTNIGIDFIYCFSYFCLFVLEAFGIYFMHRFHLSFNFSFYSLTDHVNVQVSLKFLPQEISSCECEFSSIYSTIFRA